MMKTLFLLTTANQLVFTKKTIETFNECKLKNTHLMVLDDASIDGTVAYCKRNNIDIFTKDTPSGVTNSWNIGYRHFKKKEYDSMIFANNDILIPKGAIENFLSILEHQIIVGVLSTANGVPFDKGQSFKYNFDTSELDFDPDMPENYQKTQDFLDKKNLWKKYKNVLKVNGFFFGVSRSIIRYEIDKETLFDPALINVENEYELCRRVKHKIAICLNAFIFHYKGVSFSDHDIDPNYDFGRQLTWKEAKQLKRNKTKRIVFRAKAKLQSIFTK